MRLYTFVNMYLSPIQHGIQSAHIVSELFVKYPYDQDGQGRTQHKHLYDWARNHKTIIVKNGGFASNLINIYDQISNQDQYPCAIFREGDDELNGAVTVVGIVLPESVYIIKEYRERDGMIIRGSDLDERLYDIQAQYRLA